MASSRLSIAGCSTVVSSCITSVVGSLIGGFLLVFGGAHAAAHILWLAGAPSDLHNGHLGAEAGHRLECPMYSKDLELRVARTSYE
jgi:hypothetical protein